jgi:hypothetical protein
VVFGERMTLVCYSWSTTYVRRRLRWASCLSLSICLCMYVHWAGVEPEGLCEAVVTNKYQHETPAAQQVRRPTGLRAAKFKISGFPAVCPFSNFPPSSPQNDQHSYQSCSINSEACRPHQILVPPSEPATWYCCITRHSLHHAQSGCP